MIWNVMSHFLAAAEKVHDMQAGNQWFHYIDNCET